MLEGTEVQGIAHSSVTIGLATQSTCNLTAHDVEVGQSGREKRRSECSSGDEVYEIDGNHCADLV